ncbi:MULTISPECIES: dipeptide ABC transporter ATP-binding protein [unclassified Aminobacter]|uniref:ABC transporter ATP-binding protein n=1 Tax=unclassified Aminobacter TaxID=2644704 RepID=UPI000466E02A|nr:MULTISPECIES: dipeptide ABC transporter ATP-binding protein [unclassified Aminobacter]TWG64726.1 peptide/nickel transport system ATP-binding protein [Aminobacter sp. J44]TWH36769.1 peptide/nickel transport system ATP-binding protein [Aminobacter sp. J15]
MSLLEIENLRLDIGSLPILKGVSLSLEQGEVMGLVGESGSGKSMTALAVMQLLPIAMRASGRITFDGIDILGAPEAAMNRLRGNEIGMVFQEPMTALNPVKTIGEQVAEGIRWHTRASRAEAEERARKMLDRVGLPESKFPLTRYPHELSGGQRQRVVIAIACALAPKLLIADEPTTALDVVLQKQILELLRDLVDERKMGLLLISHDLAVVADMSDRVTIMRHGEVMEAGETARTLTQQAHPYTRQLALASMHVPDRGRKDAAIGGAATTGAGLVPPPLTPPHKGEGNVGETASTHSSTKSPLRDEEPASAAEDAHARLEEKGDISSTNSSEHTASSATGTIREGVSSKSPSPLWGGVRGGGNNTSSSEGVSGQAVSAGQGVSTASRPLLSVRNVVRDYPNRRTSLFRVPDVFRAVDDVSFQIAGGQSVALVGRSGCGKSTLARMILALDRPTSGSINVDGHEVSALPEAQLKPARRSMQVVFQDPYGSFNPRHKVERLVAEPLHLLDEAPSPAERRELVADALDKVGLKPSDMGKYPHEFSGGQRQRISIARAIITRPKLIVADEPVSALDVSIRAQVLDLFADLNARLGVAYLFITHDLTVARAITDEVMVMQEGRIVETGRTDEVLDHPQSDAAKALVEAAPDLQRALERRLARLG